MWRILLSTKWFIVNQSYIGWSLFFRKKLYIYIFNWIFRHIPRQNPGLGWEGTIWKTNIIFELSIKFSTKWFIKHICVKKFKYCFFFVKQKIHINLIFNKSINLKNIFDLLNHFALFSYFQFSWVYILLYFTFFT